MSFPALLLLIKNQTPILLICGINFYMSVIFILIGVSLFVATCFLLAFLWAIKTGQYDDDYTPSVRILFDDQNDKKDNQYHE
jgi:cbb3-type cytochrome oxidase maturation protein